MKKRDYYSDILALLSKCDDDMLKAIYLSIKAFIERRDSHGL